LSELCFNRQVELHTYGLDRFGRTLAIIMLDGVDVNLEQVRSAMAWVFDRYIGQANLDIEASYRQVQREAQTSHRGLSSDPDPVEP
jgi:endonuclease YncB( thermonuclease family)